MKNNRAKRTPADKMMIAIMVAIILAVVAVGGYAVYEKVSRNIETKNIEENGGQKTVRYLADEAGMEMEEYLAQYGLTGNEAVNEKTVESEMVQQMTMDNLAKYEGKTLDVLLEENGLTGKADGNMKWADAINLVPLSVYFGGQFDAVKEAYELDDSITAETTWGEAKDAIMAAEEAYIEKMQNATPAPATEAPAEGEEAIAEGEASPEATVEAEATEAPAEAE